MRLTATTFDSNFLLLLLWFSSALSTSLPLGRIWDAKGTRFMASRSSSCWTR